MSRRGHSLIYGGGDVGSMGVLARAIQDGGGRVVGVIPHALNEQPGVGFSKADELIVTQTMRQRKAIMEENAEAFIALPGGLGTFEELLEIITLKQLRYHTKAIVVLNSMGYFDPLLNMLGRAVDDRFMKPETMSLYHVAGSVHEALDYIEAYEPSKAAVKWVQISSPKDQAEVVAEQEKI